VFCKQSTEYSGFTKGLQYFAQLTDCEEDQEAFRPLYCVSHKLKHITSACSQTVRTVGYLLNFFHVRRNSSKLDENKCWSKFVLTPVQISPGIAAAANRTGTVNRYFTGKYRANYLQVTLIDFN
jgi:hypothetical protein